MERLFPTLQQARGASAEPLLPASGVRRTRDSRSNWLGTSLCVGGNPPRKPESRSSEFPRLSLHVGQTTPW